MRTTTKYLSSIFLMISVFYSCVQDDDYNIPDINSCNDASIPVTKFIQEIYDTSSSNVIQYTASDVIEAYVTSNDQAGNFFKTLHFQSLDGSRGFSIPVDLTDLYTIFNPGRKVYIQLQNSYTQLHFEGLEIGNYFLDDATGEESIGKIPATNFKNILIKTCEVVEEEQLVNKLVLNEITDAHLNTLIELKDVQFEDAALGKTLYDANNDVGGATNYGIEDISKTTIKIRTSAFTNFGSTEVPSGNGTIRGVLTKFRNTYQLLPRSLEDLNLNQERKRIGFAETITGTQISIAEIRAIFQGTDTQILDDVYIEGVITMSGIDQNNMTDRNAFIQDHSGAIALRFSSSTSVKRGYQIKVNLKDIVLGSLRGLLQANITQYKNVLFVDENVALPAPALLTVSELNSGNYEAQLIQMDATQFEEESGTYKGNQSLTDCSDTVSILTSSEASFANDNYPTGNGKIIGIASKYDQPVLLIRDTNDTSELSQTRCEPMGDLTNQLFFSELADPNNNANARFIEIYNASGKNVDLTGWTIIRYTNDNTNATSAIDLTGNVMAVNQAFVIGINSDEFQTAYGFTPDLVGAANGPAGSNGDDNIALIDPNGTVIDIFGVIGEDGSGTNHEFEDGRAWRNTTITQGNPVYTFSEWQIWNDTGGAGTNNIPQNAPEDFTPGVR